MNDENRDYLWQRRYDVKLRALMNRLYYQERQRIFEWRENAVKAASIIIGSLAFANLADPVVFQWCVFVIMAGNTAALVFGFGNKARDSVKRSVEWAELERDIEHIGERDFSEQDINQWFARANEIEAGEPAAHPVLLEKCHNRAIVALGGTMEESPVRWCEFLPLFRIP